MAPRPDRGGRGPGLEAAKPFIKALCDAQAAPPRPPSRSQEFPRFLDYQDDVYAAVESHVGDKLAQAQQIAGKHEREDATDALKDEVKAALAGQFEGREKEISGAFRSYNPKVVRRRICADKVRIDGVASPTSGRCRPRSRDGACTTAFERGETQILGITTLNMLRMEQQLDTLSPDNRKRYMHNYNFPPYSTGETGRVGSPKRREIGHGALAERALLPVLPDREEFPYAIRQVSEALSSNGSTSMGSVCASTLSPAQRRCAARPGRGHRHGPGVRRGRRQDRRRADRHLSPRTRSVTWTSRSPAPRTSSRPCCRRTGSTASPPTSSPVR